jgi:hypothetical protein
VGLERGPLSRVSTIEVPLGRKSSGYSLESREYGRRDSSRCPRGTLYPQNLALTSATSVGRSVGIIRSRTQATEFVFVWYLASNSESDITHLRIYPSAITAKMTAFARQQTAHQLVDDLSHFLADCIHFCTQYWISHLWFLVVGWTEERRGGEGGRGTSL